MREATSTTTGADTAAIRRDALTELRRLGIDVSTHHMPPAHRFDDCQWTAAHDEGVDTRAAVSVESDADLVQVCLSCAARAADWVITEANGRFDRVTADVAIVDHAWESDTGLFRVHPCVVDVSLRTRKDSDGSEWELRDSFGSLLAFTHDGGRGREVALLGCPGVEVAEVAEYAAALAELARLAGGAR